MRNSHSLLFFSLPFCISSHLSLFNWKYCPHFDLLSFYSRWGVHGRVSASFKILELPSLTVTWSALGHRIRDEARGYLGSWPTLAGHRLCPFFLFAEDSSSDFLTSTLGERDQAGSISVSIESAGKDVLRLKTVAERVSAKKLEIKEELKAWLMEHRKGLLLSCRLFLWYGRDEERVHSRIEQRSQRGVENSCRTRISRTCSRNRRNKKQAAILCPRICGENLEETINLNDSKLKEIFQPNL